jgi:hypothetical protein
LTQFLLEIHVPFGHGHDYLGFVDFDTFLDGFLLDVLELGFFPLLGSKVGELTSSAWYSLSSNLAFLFASYS